MGIGMRVDGDGDGDGDEDGDEDGDGEVDGDGMGAMMVMMWNLYVVCFRLCSSLFTVRIFHTMNVFPISDFCLFLQVGL